jgi:serine/threonine protein kinase
VNLNDKNSELFTSSQLFCNPTKKHPLSLHSFLCLYFIDLIQTANITIPVHHFFPQLLSPFLPSLSRKSAPLFSSHFFCGQEQQMTPFIFQVGDSELEVPESFANYDILKQIGVGGFSAVVLVRDKTTSLEYACKIVSRSSLSASHTFGRFEQEVRLLEQLHHPNIVTIIDCLFQDDLIFVIMEYCSGGELFNHIVQHGRLREPDCRRIFSDIVNGISYIHARGIAHRDLKPENILLNESGVAKVADLGLCKLTAPSKLMMTTCGSPIYAAPEVLSGQGYDGKMSDIWSLGVVLYVMATAMPPWQCQNGAELFKEVSKGEFKIPGFISSELKVLIRAMMRVLPTERPTIDEVANSPWVVDEPAVPLMKKLPVGEIARGGPVVDTSRRPVIVRPISIVSGIVKTASSRAKPVESSLESLLRKVPPSGRMKPQQAIVGQKLV